MNANLRKRILSLEQQAETIERKTTRMLIYNPHVPGDLERQRAQSGDAACVIMIPDNGRPRIKPADANSSNKE